MKTAVKNTPITVGSLQSAREVTREALTEFALMHGAKLKRYLARRYGNELAEDIYQDALVETLKHRPIGAIETGSIDRYIWKVALRRASKLEVKRRLESKKAYESDMTEISDLSGREFESTQANQNFARIGEALERLSTVKRRAFIMRSTSDRSIVDIARELGITYSNARYHIADATKQVMSRMYGERLNDICESFESDIYSSVHDELGIREAQKLHRHLLHCGSCRKARREMLSAKKSVAALVPFFLLDNKAFASVFGGTGTSAGNASSWLGLKGGLLVRGASVVTVSVSVLLVAFGGSSNTIDTSGTNLASTNSIGPFASRSQTVARSFPKDPYARIDNDKQSSSSDGIAGPKPSGISGNQIGGNPAPPSNYRAHSERGVTNDRVGSGNRPSGTNASSVPQESTKDSSPPGQPPEGVNMTPPIEDGKQVSQPPQVAEEPSKLGNEPNISLPPQIKKPCNPKKFVC